MRDGLARGVASRAMNPTARMLAMIEAAIAAARQRITLRLSEANGRIPRAALVAALRMRASIAWG